jgi:hypothetical protein
VVRPLTLDGQRNVVADAPPRSAELEPNVNHWPLILGLFKSVVVALTYLRRNRVQAELAEYFGVSQSTISRAITGLTPLLGRLLVDYQQESWLLDSTNDSQP